MVEKVKGKGGVERDPRMLKESGCFNFLPEWEDYT
jgi:hypothetical protein